MEGDIDCMSDDGLDFNLIEEIIICGIGDFTEKQKIDVVDNASTCEVKDLKYKKENRYKEN